jgi:peptidoglycan/LPS O-acetylase OafA/YrhL
MGRSAGGVLAGYLMFAASSAAFLLISGRTPEANPTLIFMTISIAYGIAAGIVAGWVTGRLVGRAETAHGILLAGVIAIAALATYLYEFQFGSGFKWSQMLTMFVFAPMAVVGGVLRESQRGRARA